MNFGISFQPTQNLFESGYTDFRMRMLYADVESELNAVILSKKPITPSDTSSLSSGSPASGKLDFLTESGRVNLTNKKVNDHFSVLDSAMKPKSTRQSIKSETNSDFARTGSVVLNSEEEDGNLL